MSSEEKALATSPDDPFGAATGTPLRARLAKGMGAQAYAQAVNVVIQLVSVPLFIHAWGITLYGEWLALSAFVLYLSMADFGFGPVCANEMTMLVARSDRKGASATFQSVWLLTNAVSLLGLALVLALATFLPVRSLLHISQIDAQGAFLVLFLLGIYVLVGLQTSLLDGAFRCEGRYGLSAFLAASVQLLEFTLVVAGVLLTGGGPVMAAALYLSGRILGTVGTRVVLARVTPWIHYGVRDARGRHIVRLARPAIAYLAFPAGNALNIQGVALVVGAVLGPPALVIFATLRTLTRMALQFTQTIDRVVLPEIASAFGAGLTERVRELHRRSCQVALWLAVSIIVVLLITGDWIVRAWSRGAVHVEEPLFALLLATMALGALWWTSSVVLAATNRHPRIALIYLLADCAMLAAVYAGTRVAGLAGAAGGLLVFDAALALTVPRHSLRLVQERGSVFLRTLVQPPLFLLPIAARAAVRRGWVASR